MLVKKSRVWCNVMKLMTPVVRQCLWNRCLVPLAFVLERDRAFWIAGGPQFPTSCVGMLALLPEDHPVVFVQQPTYGTTMEACQPWNAASLPRNLAFDRMLLVATLRVMLCLPRISSSALLSLQRNLHRWVRSAGIALLASRACAPPSAFRAIVVQARRWRR